MRHIWRHIVVIAGKLARVRRGVRTKSTLGRVEHVTHGLQHSDRQSHSAPGPFRRSRTRFFRVHLAVMRAWSSLATDGVPVAPCCNRTLWLCVEQIANKLVDILPSPSGCRIIIQISRTPCSSPHRWSSEFSVLLSLNSSSQFHFEPATQQPRFRNPCRHDFSGTGNPPL